MGTKKSEIVSESGDLVVQLHVLDGRPIEIHFWKGEIVQYIDDTQLFWNGDIKCEFDKYRNAITITSEFYKMINKEKKWWQFWKRFWIPYRVTLDNN